MSSTLHRHKPNDEYMTLFRLEEKMIIMIAKLHDVKPENYIGHVVRYSSDTLDVLASQGYLYYKEARFSDKLIGKLRINKHEFTTLVQVAHEVVESAECSGMSVSEVFKKVRARMA